MIPVSPLFYKPPPGPTFEQELETLAEDLSKVANGWYAPGPSQLNQLSLRAKLLLERFQDDQRKASA